MKSKLLNGMRVEAVFAPVGCCFMICATLLASDALAEVRRDPTLPPEPWMASRLNADAGMSDVGVGTQMTLVGKGRRLAWVNGETVKPGEIFKGSRVVTVRSGRVILEDETKSMAVLPAVQKTPAKPTSKRIKRDVVLSGISARVPGEN